MKKLFLFSMAAVGMLFASCSSDETVETSPRQDAIQFKGFVNKSTRATDLTTASLEAFKVWGVMKKGDVVGKPFVARDITKTGGEWTYGTPLVYWEKDYSYSFVALAPNNASYTFAAPENYQEWGNVTFNNGDGTKDLLYAAKDAGTIAAGACPASVGLTFNHMLSRVRFQFTNGMEDGSDIKVTDIVITNAPSKGVATLAETLNGIAWTSDTPQALSFGDITSQVSLTVGRTNHKFMIPATEAYTITFKVTRKHHGVIDTYNHSVTIPSMTMKPGQSYQFATVIDATNVDPEDSLCPIKFTATVEDWADYTDTNVVLPTN